MINLHNFDKVKTYGSGLGDWDNLLLYGDNLKTLKLLQKEEAINGHVKLVYIDPPFATNNVFKGGNGERTATISYSNGDEIAYHDTLKGQEYLDFLKERLFLIRELMADDGSIYLHIDCKIGHYVKIVMDEVFGKDRFINDITRIKANPKNFERKAYGNEKDMILYYSKTEDYVWNSPTKPFTPSDIKRLFPKKDERGRRYTTTPLHAPGETVNGSTGSMWQGSLPPKGRHWRYAVDELDRLDKQGLIERSKTGVARKIIYADEVVKKGMKIQDVWEFKDPQYPSYPTEKNIDMLKLIVNASSNKGDIVMDAFLGSGTTVVAAELLNRKWIGLDDSKMAINTATKRLLKLDDKAHTLRRFTVYAADGNKVGIKDSLHTSSVAAHS